MRMGCWAQNPALRLLWQIPCPIITVAGLQRTAGMWHGRWYYCIPGNPYSTPCMSARNGISRADIKQRLIQLEGFLGHRYPVERLAFNGTHLASGAHREVKVWAQKPNGEFVFSMFYASSRYIDILGSWKLIADLRAPRRSAYTTKCDIITTSLHWTSGPSHPVVLLVTYLSHGVA